MFVKINKSDNWNTRHAKQSFKRKLKRKIHIIENKKEENTRIFPTSKKKDPFKFSKEIQNFYNINKNKISTVDSSFFYKNNKEITLSNNFCLFEDPENVLITLLDMLSCAQNKHDFITLSYKDNASFSALYFIDTICWEIANAKRWHLKLNNLPEKDMELLSNLKSFQTHSSETNYVYYLNSKIYINRNNTILAKQNHVAKSKEIRDLIKRGINDNSLIKQDLSLKEHNAIDSAISEHFDNILLHAPKTSCGFLCGIYDKYRKEIIILIYNFGPTIAETLNKNSLPEHVKKFKYQVINNYVKNKALIFNSTFCKENVLTLLAIQEGISSMLDADESRGHGLIDYINHCFELSNDTRISIISGNTAIKIDNKYKISKKNVLNRERKIIALNDDNDIFTKPNSNYLKNMKISFPGVIIETIIPLNK